MFAKQEHYLEARMKQLEAERDKLKSALAEIKNLGIGDQMIYAHKIVDEVLKEST